MAKTQFEQAAQATDAIQEHVGKAISILESRFNGRIVNGYGIYSDPSYQHAALRDARLQIDVALRIYRETSWPTNSDYDGEPQ